MMCVKIEMPKEIRSDGSRYLELMRKIASENPSVKGLEADIESLASCIAATMNAAAARRRATYEQAKAMYVKLCYDVTRGKYVDDMSFEHRIRLYYLALRLRYVALVNSIPSCSQIAGKYRYVSVRSGADNTMMVYFVGGGSSLDLEAEFVSWMSAENGIAIRKKDLMLITACNPEETITLLPEFFDGFVKEVMVSDGCGGIDIYEEESTSQKAP